MKRKKVTGHIPKNTLRENRSKFQVHKIDWHDSENEFVIFIFVGQFW